MSCTRGGVAQLHVLLPAPAGAAVLRCRLPRCRRPRLMPWRAAPSAVSGLGARKSCASSLFLCRSRLQTRPRRSKRVCVLVRLNATSRLACAAGASATASLSSHAAVLRRASCRTPLRCAAQSQPAMPPPFVLHAHGSSAERTASLRAALAAAPLASPQPLCLAAADDAPPALNAAAYFAALKARARARASMQLPVPDAAGGSHLAG